MNGTNASVEEISARKKRQSSSVSNIELMVYVDAGVQNDAAQNGFSVIEYILGIINIVGDSYISIFSHLNCYIVLQMARLYRDSTLQHQVDLTMTRLILEGVNVRMYILLDTRSLYLLHM